MDDLLGNTLPPNVTVEIVTCESKAAVLALWQLEAGEDAGADSLWMIHPAIADRTRNSLRGGSPDLVITFQEWSASLDASAADVLSAAAAQAAQRPEMAVALVRHAAADGPAMLADLGNLRAGLLEARLTALGVAAERIVRDVLPAETPAQADQVNLVLRLPA